MLQTRNLWQSYDTGRKKFGCLAGDPNFAPGEVAEWSIAAVLKTVEGYTSVGSNPSLSANGITNAPHRRAFVIPGRPLFMKKRFIYTIILAMVVLFTAYEELSLR